MKFNNAFYTEFHAMRAAFGVKSEYALDDLVPQTEALVRKHKPSEDVMIASIARNILNNAAQHDEAGKQASLFSNDEHAALDGKGRYIQRGAMKVDHLLRRSSLLDKGKRAQDESWAKENTWIHDKVAALMGRDFNTTVADLDIKAA